MRKLFLTILMLCFTSTCFGADTYIRNRQNTIISPYSNGTSIYTGQQTAISSSTVAVLSYSSPISSITIRASSANTENIYIGGASTLSENNGYALASGATITLYPDYASDIYYVCGSRAGWAADNSISYIITVQ